MPYLDPWWSTQSQSAEFHQTFQRQLALEVPPGHVLDQLPVRLVARGEGDDCLFELLDGSGRFAHVHLTWAKQQERLPWPATSLFSSWEEWSQQVMIPQHREWSC